MVEKFKQIYWLYDFLKILQVTWVSKVFQNKLGRLFQILELVLHTKEANEGEWY